MAMKKSGIVGLEKVLVNLGTTNKQIEDEVKAITSEIAYKIERDAKLNSPVDTGYLRNSIQTEFENGGYVARVFTAADYAIFVEFGTSKQPAQPFLFPAAFKFSAEYQRRLKQIL
jgi:HK97 gp10 family phage protein